MTREGSLLEFVKSSWGLSTPVGTADIVWSEGWFNPLFPYSPQLTVSPLVSPKITAMNSSGSLTFRYEHDFLVNLWNQIPPGSSGTTEVYAVEAMRKEVARVLRTGIVNAYGGSLSPFTSVLPIDMGVVRHDPLKTPRVLRYEITVQAITNANE